MTRAHLRSMRWATAPIPRRSARPSYPIALDAEGRDSRGGAWCCAACLPREVVPAMLVLVGGKIEARCKDHAIPPQGAASGAGGTWITDLAVRPKRVPGHTDRRETGGDEASARRRAGR